MQRKTQYTINFLVVAILLISIVPLAVLAAPPAQEEATCVAEYTVQVGDSLSKIAAEYMGNGMAYPAIVEATNQKNAVDDTFAKITDPTALRVGWKLCLPSADVLPPPAEAAPAEAAETVTDLTGEGWSPAAFAAGAFPSPFPIDSRHEDTWFNDKCQTCHEKQIDDAPAIPHDVWTPNCRSCHVPSTQALEPAVGDWAPSSFAVGAFPPPYPPDSRHGDAWFNEQCQTCHEEQQDEAPEIPHDVWTQNCRSCHVPAEQENQ